MERGGRGWRELQAAENEGIFFAARRIAAAPLRVSLGLCHIILAASEHHCWIVDQVFAKASP